MKNPKKKGSKYENEVLETLKEINPTAGKGKRNWQFFGNNKGVPDVSVPGLEDLHLECKRTESFSFKKYQDQTIGDSNGKVPIIVHRFNRRPDWVCLPLLECTKAAVAWLEWLGWRLKPPKQ